ncbi:MAG: phage portal protein [Clostridiales bacterium]|nr:phage portal protein [Clostridiales bacterium]
MAFNLLKWILRKTGSDPETATGDFLEASTDYDADVLTGLAAYLQKMAFWSCVRRIGSTVSLVEWDTYRRGRRVQAGEAWAWTYAPNPNETRAEFFRHLVSQLYLTQEAIVVEYAGGRYVADGFTVERRLTGNIYRNVTSDGQSIPGVFGASAVLHFTIEGSSIQASVNAIAATESDLLKATAKKIVRDSGGHGVLNVHEIAEQDPDFEGTYTDLVTDKMKKYFTSDNSVLPIFDGYEFQDTSASAPESTRDVRAMMDDIMELTAEAFGVPPSIATGKGVTDQDFTHFMNTIIKPLASMIAQELNSKLYGQSRVFAGSYIVPNYSNVRYRDLFDIADPIDKLIGSGTFCINEIRVRLGEATIDEPWAWQHWMTKNYAPAADQLDGIVDGKPRADPMTDPTRTGPDTEADPDEEEQSDPEDPGEEVNKDGNQDQDTGD